MKRRRSKTRLPRLTLLAYSEQDLHQLAAAFEEVTLLSRQLQAAIAEACALVAASAVVAGKLERRSEGARKANRTRSAARTAPGPAEPDGPPDSG